MASGAPSRATMVSRLAKEKWNLRTRNRRSSRERSMSGPSQNRFVIGSVALLYFLISVSSFAQNAGDSGAHYRDLAASNRSLAADYRNRAQAWRDLAQKARSRQSKSNSAAMKQILGD